MNTWTMKIRNARPPKQPAQLSVRGTCLRVRFSSMTGVRWKRSSNSFVTRVMSCLIMGAYAIMRTSFLISNLIFFSGVLTGPLTAPPSSSNTAPWQGQ